MAEDGRKLKCYCQGAIVTVEGTVQNFQFKIQCQSLSCVRLFVTLWIVTYQALLPMRFSRQEYWSGLPFSSPEDLSDPGIEPMSPALQAYSLPLAPPGKPQNIGE